MEPGGWARGACVQLMQLLSLWPQHPRGRGRQRSHWKNASGHLVWLTPRDTKVEQLGWAADLEGCGAAALPWEAVAPWRSSLASRQAASKVAHSMPNLAEPRPQGRRRSSKVAGGWAKRQRRGSQVARGRTNCPLLDHQLMQLNQLIRRLQESPRTRWEEERD